MNRNLLSALIIASLASTCFAGKDYTKHYQKSDNRVRTNNKLNQQVQNQNARFGQEQITRQEKARLRQQRLLAQQAAAEQNPADPNITDQEIVRTALELNAIATLLL